MLEAALRGIPIRRRRLRAGEVLFHQGDPGESAQLVLAGLVGIEVASRHREPVIARLVRQGEVVAAERLLLPGTRHESTGRALVPSEVQLIMPGELETAGVHKCVLPILATHVANQTRDLFQRVVEMAHLSASARVANSLCRLADEFGIVGVTQEVVAGVAGVVRATANAELRELAERSVVTIGRKRITIVDRVTLQRLSQ